MQFQFKTKKNNSLQLKKYLNRKYKRINFLCNIFKDKRIVWQMLEVSILQIYLKQVMIMIIDTWFYNTVMVVIYIMNKPKNQIKFFPYLKLFKYYPKLLKVQKLFIHYNIYIEILNQKISSLTLPHKISRFIILKIQEYKLADFGFSKPV